MLSNCGGTSSTTTAPPMQAPDQPPVVTITSAGADPRELHIFAKDAATFVNHDAEPHEVRSDPTQNNDLRCTSVGVGLLLPGESRKSELQPSGIVCFYRDERDPTNFRLKGYVLAHY
jgi:hypothetical protein